MSAGLHAGSIVQDILPCRRQCRICSCTQRHFIQPSLACEGLHHFDQPLRRSRSQTASYHPGTRFHYSLGDGQSKLNGCMIYCHGRQRLRVASKQGWPVRACCMLVALTRAFCSSEESTLPCAASLTCCKASLSCVSWRSSVFADVCSFSSNFCTAMQSSSGSPTSRNTC